MNIDYKQLRNVCTRPIESFGAFGEVTRTPDGIYITAAHPDNRVLAVAHLDAVLNSKYFEAVKTKRGTLVFNGALDDRLGAYAILHLLPSLGLKYDILLTEGEETGRSTAAHFETDKKYNWMFSFDRRGDDVVMYQYDNKGSRDLLKYYDFTPSVGSFSDIASLEHLGCVGFNFGTGYYNEHTKNHFANMKTFASQIRKFTKMFQEVADKKMTHSRPSAKDYSSWGWHGRLYPDYNEWDGRDFPSTTCSFCGMPTDQDKCLEWEGYILCDKCVTSMGRCTVCGELREDTELVGGICMDCKIDMSDGYYGAA